MRSWILWIGLMAAGLLVAVLAYGCAEHSFGTCADNATCPVDGGSLDVAAADDASDVTSRPDAAGLGDDGGAPPKEGGPVPDTGPATCDAGLEPKDERCLLDETYGVFVSTMGTASGAGTKTSPLNSIGAAIALAVPEGGATPKNVYVCAGTYDETIAIGAVHDKAKVYGGFTCANAVWTYTGDLPKIAPTAQGVVLSLTGLTGALFADLEIDAQSAPATAPATGSASGASSIAVTVSSSTGVEFRRAKIVAGNGQPGADGVLVPYTFPTAADLRGNAADGGAGGPAKPFTCPGGLTTTGGKGGDAPAGSGDPGLPALGGGAGGTSASCVGGTIGMAGASPASASNGNGAPLGAMATSAWVPGAGMAGTTGAPGQGGGGGGGVSPGGGGSGGAGGCGGAGGGSGGGGGASVAVLCVTSDLTFANVTLVTATGGNGGVGVTGQPGETDVGNGGLPDQNGGCPGGRGGAGGAGGAGGGGAGGVSAAILYKGDAPTIDTLTTAKFVQGQPGTKGTGGVPGTNDGVSGLTGVQVPAP